MTLCFGLCLSSYNPKYSSNVWFARSAEHRLPPSTLFSVPYTRLCEVPGSCYRSIMSPRSYTRGRVLGTNGIPFEDYSAHPHYFLSPTSTTVTFYPHTITLLSKDHRSHLLPASLPIQHRLHVLSTPRLCASSSSRAGTREPRVRRFRRHQRRPRHSSCFSPRPTQISAACASVKKIRGRED